MAKKTITAGSSFEDRSQAAAELAAAQQQLNTWLNSQTNPTYSQIANQSRYIAGQYDYVDWGNPPPAISGSGPIELTVGGEQFFVNGIGTNPNSVSVPTDIVPSTDDAFSPAPVITDPTQTLPSNPQQPNQIVNPLDPANRQTTDTFNSGSLLEDPNVTSSANGAGGVDSSGREIPQPDPLVAQSQTNVVEQPGSVATNTQSVNPSNTNTDDQGGNSGTGLDSGFPQSSDAGSDNLNTGEDVDPNRESENGTDPGSPTNGTNPGVVAIDQTGKTQVSPGTGEEQNNSNIQLRQNVLHNYANWTYNIALYMLKPADLSSATSSSTSGVLLMKSGGTGGNNGNTFNRDYYIESLRFTSIIGQNARTTKTSNNFDIEMVVMEPYGVALLPELILQSQQLGIESHFETPYLIEISFKGYDDQGKPAPELANYTKKIPVKIITFDFSISSAGTRYTIGFVPYHHSVLIDTDSTKIKGSVSVYGETFKELIDKLKDKINAQNEKEAKESKYSDFDKVEFQIAPTDSDLESAKVGFPVGDGQQVVQKDRYPMGPGGGSDKQETIQIEDGTILKNAIERIYYATDFGARKNTRNQPRSEGDKKPVRLIKVVPVIKNLTKFIPEQKRYAREIVYHIFTEKVRGVNLPDVANAPVPDRGWVKEYNWIFTGKNQDIFNFEANYNLQYFMARTSFQDLKGIITTGADGVQGANFTSTPGTPAIGGNVYDIKLTNRMQHLRDKVGNSFRSGEDTLANDIADHFLNNPGADMLTVDLEIVGDPDWIPQDTSVVGGSGINPSPNGFSNNSIAIDENSIHTKLIFKTPRDYDDASGLMKLESSSAFIQGLYKVITVENNFSNGKFTSKLEMIRDGNQNANDSSNTGTLSGQPDSGRPDLPPGQFSNPTPTASTNPSVNSSGTTPNSSVSVGTVGNATADDGFV